MSNRRDFLKKAGGLALLTIVPPELQKTCEDGQLSFADLA